MTNEDLLQPGNLLYNSWKDQLIFITRDETIIVLASKEKIIDDDQITRSLELHSKKMRDDLDEEWSETLHLIGNSLDLVKLMENRNDE